MLPFLYPILWAASFDVTVEAQTLDGQVQSATLDENAQGMPELRVTAASTPNNASPTPTDNGSATRLLPWDQVQEIRFPHDLTDRPSPPSVTVTLHDGSVVRFASVHLQDGRMRVTGSSADLHQLSLEHLRSVHFVEFEEPQRERWEELLSLAQPEDLLVVRKGSGKLDYLAGLVQGLNNDRVQFRYDGQVLDVRLEKVAGVIFPTKAAVARPIATLQMRQGSRWQLAHWRPRGETIEADSAMGLALKIAPTDIVAIEFQQNAVTFLSDLIPRTSQWVPFVADTQRTSVLSELFAPCRDQSFAGQPLQLLLDDAGHVRTYTKGLALHSQTRLSYRLAGEYQRFTADMGMDPESNGLGHVVLKIFCDDKEVFQQVVESSVVVPIAVDLQGCQQLEILVDFGEGQDLGDRLHLGDARLYR